MASYFRIILNHKKVNLYIELIGEFDKFSAIELIRVLKEYNGKIKNIIINTSGIDLIHPFGLSLLHKECINDNSLHGLRFIGKHGNMMEPATSCTFWY